MNEPKMKVGIIIAIGSQKKGICALFYFGMKILMKIKISVDIK